MEQEADLIVPLCATLPAPGSPPGAARSPADQKKLTAKPRVTRYTAKLSRCMRTARTARLRRLCRCRRRGGLRCWGPLGPGRCAVGLAEGRE